jgi:asparagine synthase (glutamine-hydrolysing)
MCRIAGIWKQGESGPLEALCTAMRDTMVRGGPDAAGTYVDHAAGLAMGHRRLSIIDLTPSGSQPMTGADGRYVITYNGEVYNYQEIRPRLEALGYRFQGTSDTEVVLNAFAAWGPECVREFVGMFAFALWDSAAKSLYLFRDRMGVKPLYYYHKGSTFAFASELKALHKGLEGRLEVDPETLGEFFHYGYISGPRSIYRHTRKLEPGHWLKVSPGFGLENHRYWAPPDVREECGAMDEGAYIDQLEEIMKDAFSKRLIADVPVGVFLSGGVDSSLVTAILARHTSVPVKTFTIGFQEKNYDESGWAKRIAAHLGTEHTEETVTPEHAREILPLWPEIYDEPFGDISGIPTTIVSRMTREHVKVSLSADGGDELFCGYHRYWVMNGLDRVLSPLPDFLPKAFGRIMGVLGSDRAADLAQAHPGLRLPAIKDRMRKLQAVLSHWKGDAASAYPFSVGYWLPHEVNAFMGRYDDPRPALDTSKGLLQGMMAWDMVHYLPEDILAKVDRATMYCSLEGRDPFLDHRIVEFACTLPLSLKRSGGEMKYILKRLLARYLPEELFMRPKQGFAVPVYSWLHDDLMDLVNEYLNPDALRQQTLFDPGAVLKTVNEFIQKKGSVAVDRVWLLLVFMMWKRRYGA